MPVAGRVEPKLTPGKLDDGTILPLNQPVEVNPEGVWICTASNLLPLFPLFPIHSFPHSFAALPASRPPSVPPSDLCRSTCRCLVGRKRL
ncbi:hypothetical protein DPX16_3923 [Anabarilius grahami]|uniref:Uncharacterized protein n=1 Tax=Anabarilius grahami TaxID=495550 RepID=A0A3N0XKB6_ANAGA|nr:hypothetical protein DPX16_3923 [Anabarilius grahami]